MNEIMPHLPITTLTLLEQVLILLDWGGGRRQILAGFFTSKVGPENAFFIETLLHILVRSQ